MSVNLNEPSQKRTCEKCGQHGGEIYSFYYGKKKSHTMRNVGQATIHTTKYEVAGMKDGAVCNNCVRTRRGMRLVVFGLMVVVGAGLALWAAGWDQFKDPERIREAVQLQMFTLGVAGILGLTGLWGLLPSLFASKNTHAENMLITLKKGELRRQGFDTFWNNKSFNKLRRG